MATSQNGWGASDRAQDFAPFPWVTGRVHPGDAFTVLDYLARRFHTEVEPITRDWSWGWAWRDIRGTTRNLSNHSSGTAVDFNAPVHALGARHTFTPAQVDAIRRILASLRGCVRWGGDYYSRADEMHFEIVAGPITTSIVAAAIGTGTVSNPIGGGGNTPAPVPGQPVPNPIEETDPMSTPEVLEAIAQTNAKLDDLLSKADVLVEVIGVPNVEGDRSKGQAFFLVNWAASTKRGIPPTQFAYLKARGQLDVVEWQPTGTLNNLTQI